MSNEISRLVPQLFSSGIARQTKRETELIVARTEIAQTLDQGRALLTSAAISNVGNLVALGEQIARVTPSSAAQVEMLITAYSAGAANQIARFPR